MLKALNLGCALRFNGVFTSRITGANYCSESGGKKGDIVIPKDDDPIEPLQLSYNSYENLSKDPSTPPVIIMHGKITFFLFQFTLFVLNKYNYSLTFLQAYLDPSKIGVVSAKLFTQNRVPHERSEWIELSCVKLNSLSSWTIRPYLRFRLSNNLCTNSNDIYRFR